MISLLIYFLYAIILLKNLFYYEIVQKERKLTMQVMDKSPIYVYHKLINCPKHLKITFISSFIFGLLSHMYIMTNFSPNADVCSAYFGYGAGYTSGRWGLSLLGDFIGTLFGNYSLPWLNGSLAILFLAISSIFIIKALEIHNELYCIFISAIMVTFPSITATFTYIFTVQYYCFSILLTCAALYLIRKYSKGWIAGVVCLAFSLGIYQAYLGIACSFFLVFLILDMLQSKKTVMQIFIDAWKYLGILAASVVLYFICNKLALMITHHQLSEYMGINTMGKPPLNRLPQILCRIYAEFLAPAFVDRYGISQLPLIKISYFIFLLFTLYFGVRIIYLTKIKKGAMAMYLTAFILVLFPFALNIIYIMCFEGTHTLMRYSIVAFYIAFITIWDKNKHSFFKEKQLPFTEWIVIGLFSITIGNFCMLANETYLCLNQNYRQACSFYNVLIAQIKMAEGYDASTPVALIGKIQDPTFPTISAFDNLENLSGVFNGIDYINIYSRNNFIKYFCGFAPPIVNDTSTIEQSSQFKEMPVYPACGSVGMIDGTLVVKFED